MRHPRPGLLTRFLMVRLPASGLLAALPPPQRARARPQFGGAGTGPRRVVVHSNTSYTLDVTDSSHPANSFTTTQSCSGCANSSAEWIAEAPSGSSGVYPRSNVGTWTESGATVKAGSTSGVIPDFTDDEITMIDSSGAIEAQPGDLNGNGNGFSLAWKRST